MRRGDFDYFLPDELIAQRPPVRRGTSRLLHLPPEGGVVDLSFQDFPALLRPDDVLILNDTRVVPARLRGTKPTGGQVEILLERVLDGSRILAQVHASNPLRIGVPLALPGGVQAHYLGRQGELFEMELTLAANESPLAYFERHGTLPLPPYIERTADAQDAARYQTVFARTPGAVAAPTAGLHFDTAMLERCRERGASIAYVTLHVGAGTFQPVRVEALAEHRMHAERVSVNAETCEAIARARSRGGRVLAVGTTVVRSLEAAASASSQTAPSAPGEPARLAPFHGDTRLFITPGFRFQVVDALLTNFHLPQSTLLMLVCAFGGHAAVMQAYRHAVQRRYRFFSYGDAMFLERMTNQTASGLSFADPT
ncbi:S-adenosylmethionine tRNA ribosyltransferase [Steroidobacter denitrificans]|uniref:S-adenosylmethionine:tRNA ribosyltransferase-isomerase n=1 Tax=Steroidobacter denitrificans TaxID=465721 RepID=A0A127FAY4_STEDE|nr:tRNA preQ1(34) S-adenosylmethionine ribosyltransferase-isomerase QueA [Steroidobacter denitrificans]AMN46755.1 S-adenosylmethionine tRNA ribosyltransferase [Steroidobacter denitrificans]